jgi:hypothetical protein
MDFEGALGPDDEIGGGDLFVDRPLGGNTLVDGFAGPTALCQARPLGRSGTSDANDMSEVFGGARFEEERNDDHRATTAFRAPRPDLIEPALANARMKDGFELLSLLRVSEDGPRDFAAAQLAGIVDYLGAKGLANFLEGGLARFDELASQFVGVNDREAAPGEDGSGRGFAHANPTR